MIVFENFWSDFTPRLVRGVSLCRVPVRLSGPVIIDGGGMGRKILRGSLMMFYLEGGPDKKSDSEKGATKNTQSKLIKSYFIQK